MWHGLSPSQGRPQATSILLKMIARHKESLFAASYGFKTRGRVRGLVVRTVFKTAEAVANRLVRSISISTAPRKGKLAKRN
jgi:hypothetical protein